MTNNQFPIPYRPSLTTHISFKQPGRPMPTTGGVHMSDIIHTSYEPDEAFDSPCQSGQSLRSEDTCSYFNAST